MDGNFEQAKNFFLRGLELYQSGRFVEAEASYAASLALLPGRASTLTNLGATRLKLGKLEDAIELLQEAVAKEPGNVEALGHLSVALAEAGHRAAALEIAERLLQLEPGAGNVWGLRGTLLKELGRLPEAATSFQNAVARGADTDLNRYQLASLNGGNAPARPPQGYVEALFDSYAHGFEEHLTQVLRYRAPEILADGLKQRNKRFSNALDLGCGTGLCGLLLRPLVERLEGVDLSSNMVGQATARGVYDRVVQDDVVHFLENAATPYDLVIAADVFIYVGALDAVFAAAARAMPSGGVFCFSIEAAADGEDFMLRPSLRYAHSRAYIERLAGANGFAVDASSQQPIREDQKAPVAGLFIWLVKR